MPPANSFSALMDFSSIDASRRVKRSPKVVKPAAPVLVISSTAPTSGDGGGSGTTAVNGESNGLLHRLSNKWTVYAHLPHDTDWSIASYKEILTASHIEEMIALTEAMPPSVVSNCMLFIMRDNVKPIWEDKYNKDGGCFSYKINNNSVVDIWKKLSYKLVGNTLLKNNQNNNVNGITISPKKNFCIIKIWMSNCSNKDPETIDYFKGLTSYGCLFKKHIVK